jgi:hypothetical protein
MLGKTRVLARSCSSTSEAPVQRTAARHNKRATRKNLHIADRMVIQIVATRERLLRVRRGIRRQYALGEILRPQRTRAQDDRF